MSAERVAGSTQVVEGGAAAGGVAGEGKGRLETLEDLGAGGGDDRKEGVGVGGEGCIRVASELVALGGGEVGGGDALGAYGGEESAGRGRSGEEANTDSSDARSSRPR